MAEYPEWHPEEAPDYDSNLSASGAQVLTRLRSDAGFCASVLTDPRELHRTLYAHFAPAAYPEYAGTYRGTPNSPLESRYSGCQSLLDGQPQLRFLSPEQVPSAMENILPAIAAMRANAETPWDRLWALTNLFVQFGKVHPFLDGNGHVQRVLFAAGALEMGVPLSNRFAIHPRSYDFLLAHSLECFTRSGDGQWAMAVAEYLAQWLDGPFDAPGSGLPPE
tara:strand:+ start:6076 stop:6738 length:663 start_codon:yes stop_codon:yes gene_type:complete